MDTSTTLFLTRFPFPGLCRRKKLLWSLLLCLPALPAMAQTPAIQSVSHEKAAVSEPITINGAGFGSAAEMEVYFGGASAEISQANSSTITALVPAAATFGPIRVINKASGLSARSGKPFSPAFGGREFSADNLSTPNQFPANSGIYDLQLVDLDEDGRSEAVITNKASTSISIYQNNSSIGAIGFTKIDFPVGGRTETLTYGDVDGDGKTDLLLKGSGAAYNNKLYFVRNSSSPGTLSFDTAIPFTLSTTGDGRLALHDFDGDGKPELVLSQSSNQVSIFRNQSTPGTLSFSTEAVNLALPGGATAFGLAIADLDGDNKADMVVGNNYGRNLYILPNQCTAGNIQFGAPTTINTADGNLNLMVGDIDNDSKPDIAVANVSRVFVGVLLNTTSTTGNIQFGGMSTFSTELRPWGLQMTDIDGDGLTDLLVAHSDSPDISVFKNYSSPGEAGFVQSLIPNLGKNYAVRGGDIDGDGKPEVVFTDYEFNRLSVLRNSSCREARIQPQGSHTICSGTPFQLTSLQGAGVDHTWFKDGEEISGASSHVLEVSASGNYTVTLTEAADGCSSTSSPVAVTVVDGSMETPEFYAIDPACLGGNLLLSATPIAEASYHWTGPNGFSQTTTSASLTIEGVSQAMAGNYQLQVTVGPCQSQELTQYATILEQSQPVINQPENTAVCANTPIVLSLQGSYDSYQWHKNGQAISGATAATYSAAAEGTYSVSVANTSGCPASSEGLVISQGNAPDAHFENPGTACLNQEVTFTNTTTATINQALVYHWDFGDGSTSSQESPTHTYASAEGSPYTVSLKVRYSNGSCEDIFTQPLSVVEPAEEVSIEAAGGTALCPGSSLPLQIAGESLGVSWSNGATGSSIEVTEPGTYTASIQTQSGCVLSRSIAIESLPGPTVEVSADKTLIRAGESVQLQASGGTSYEWAPDEGLSNPNIANPIARPSQTTTYTLTAYNAEGCSTTDSLTIALDTQVYVKANKLFIPGQESFWRIEDIENYPNLSLSIMNRFGTLVYTAQPYRNRWDGWYKGRILDEGVYYYVLKDEQGKAVKSGTITLVH